MTITRADYRTVESDNPDIIGHTVTILPDEDAESPAENDDGWVGEIWYRADSRCVLGTTPIDDPATAFTRLLLGATEKGGASAVIDIAINGIEDEHDRAGWKACIDECEDIGSAAWNYLADDPARGRTEDVIRVLEMNGYVIMPVYAHIHGGVAMSTLPFHYSGDSGQSGWAVASPEDAERIGVGWQDMHGVLEAQIEVYSAWAEGRVYGYTIEDEEGDIVDSCWRFIGDEPEDNGMLDYAGPEYLDALDEAMRCVGEPVHIIAEDE